MKLYRWDKFLFVKMLFFAVVFPNIVLGQSLSRSEEILSVFDMRFEELDSLIFSAMPLTVNVSERVGQDSMAIGDLYDPSVYEEKLQADVLMLKSQNGLEISGQTYYRLDEGLGWDEEDAVSRYNGKIQVELAWAFFQSSYFQRKGKIRSLQLERQIAQNKFEQQLLSAYTEETKDVLRLHYHQELAGILLHRIKNLRLIDIAYRHLLETERISSDELLDVLNEKAEAERMLAALSGEYEASDNLSEPVGIAVSIDTVSLVGKIRECHSAILDIKMRSDLLEQQYENTNYLQQVSIAPFVRCSYYLRQDLKNSSNVDVGIRFKLPLSGEVRKKRKVIAAEKRLLSCETLKVEQQMMNEVRRLFVEIERLNNLSDGEIKRIRSLKLYLEDRKKAYECLIGEYSLLARMKEYNMYLSCWESLVDFQYRRDCLLNDLQRMLGNLSLGAYSTVIVL